MESHGTITVDAKRGRLTQSGTNFLAAWPLIHCRVCHDAKRGVPFDHAGRCPNCANVKLVQAAREMKHGAAKVLIAAIRE